MKRLVCLAMLVGLVGCGKDSKPGVAVLDVNKFSPASRVSLTNILDINKSASSLLNAGDSSSDSEASEASQENDGKYDLSKFKELSESQLKEMVKEVKTETDLYMTEGSEFTEVEDLDFYSAKNQLDCSVRVTNAVKVLKVTKFESISVKEPVEIMDAYKMGNLSKCIAEYNLNKQSIHFTRLETLIHLDSIEGETMPMKLRYFEIAKDEIVIVAAGDLGDLEDVVAQMYISIKNNQMRISETVVFDKNGNVLISNGHSKPVLGYQINTDRFAGKEILAYIDNGPVSDDVMFKGAKEQSTTIIEDFVFDLEKIMSGEHSNQNLSPIAK